MRAQPLGAVLSISVDLPLVEHGTNRDIRNVREVETVERVYRLFTAAKLPATWFADDPATDETLGRLSAAGHGHEAGMRVARDRIGEDSGETVAERNPVVAELVGRKFRAQQAGIAITTLALFDAAKVPAELLVKHGITAVRAVVDEQQCRRIEAAGPVPLRYGLWRVTPDFRLTGAGRIADWQALVRIRRAIDRCIRSRTPLHLIVDAATIAANSAPERLGGMPAILRHVERRRNAGLLQVCTIAEVVARLAAPVPARAGGSILRAA